MKINAQILKGKWKYGKALDLHTISSTFVSGRSFETKRTELGELLYRLKYDKDKKKIREISKVVADFLKKGNLKLIDAIVPAPPSVLKRRFQPVYKLAKRIGKELKLKVHFDYIIKAKQTEALKDIEDNVSRKEILKDAFKVCDKRFKGKNVLLFDDIYRSGETLNAITEVLINYGEVKNVYVLTITKTRTKR